MSRHERTGELELHLPASSANLGPAFDSAAVALDLHLHVRAAAATGFSIEARGRDAELCGTVEPNLILDTYRDTLASADRACVPLALTVDNEIPIGTGCGSSSAARLAGIALANYFGGLGWTDEQIMDEAIRLEGHADNVAACWLGGFVIVTPEAARPQLPPAIRLKEVAGWPLLLVVSRDPLSTEHSRALLPREYRREQAVANVQSAMALVAAYLLGRAELFAAANHDRLHQPYRAAACPVLSCLQPLAGQAGILAVTLSGAGKSVLLTLRPEASQSDIRAMLSERLHAVGLEAELIFTSIAEQGARRIELPARALAPERA